MSEAAVKAIFSLAPFLILIGVWIFFMRKVGGGKEYRQQLSGQMDAQLEASREIARQLNRIATALEQRQP
jgi:hypothetical protein